MIQQSPDRRVSTIEAIKKELMGRRNAFVALQEYDATKKKVVPASRPDDFEPLTLVGLDYSGGILSLKPSGNVPSGWTQEFQNPRNGHTAISGYGPEAFSIGGNVISIGVREDERFVQQLVDHAKNYVAAANVGYAQQQSELAARLEREQRAALERKVAEAELRKNIVSKIRL
jgi:hypothetical protein